MLVASARANFQRGSARKMRQVVDLVRGKPVDEALSLLSVLPKAAAQPVRKTVQSAAANALAAEGTAHLKSEDLRIAKITVDGGPIMKRIRPMGMGRAYRINKRLCHLTVVLEGVPHVSQPAGRGTSAGAAARADRSPAERAKSGGAKSAKGDRSTFRRTTGRPASQGGTPKPPTGKKDT
jgi:large subunit ribosomal protein L22